jgi:hypothetical protein
MSHRSAGNFAARLVEAAPIYTDPFPHIVADGIFPEFYYRELLGHLPPTSALSIPVKFGMMKLRPEDVTFQALPAASQNFWSAFDTVTKPAVCAALLRRFLPYAENKLALIFGRDGLGKELEPDEFRPLRGIVQCRIAGARMGAHVDKATSLFTYLFYFAPDDSLRPFGTVFYEAKDRAAVLERYRANRGIRAWFPADGELELEARPPLEFCRNRLVSYLNLPYSLHGAATDAEAPRYSMQNYCDLPRRITLPLFEGWNDPISATGVYAGDE